MTTAVIRKKLADYMQRADDKKVKAMYALFEDEIENDETEYSHAFKQELESRYQYYKNGGKMISSTEADRQIKKILKTGKQ